MNRLKQYRVAAGMTRALAADGMGVDPVLYSEWEVGSKPIPKTRLPRLAKLFGTDAKALLDRHPPIGVSAGFEEDDDLNWYGEVAFHFSGGGEPLLLSISQSVFEGLHHDFDQGPSFVVARSLANQTVLVRTAALTDVHFSSEAYDDYGPEDGSYPRFSGLLMPDARDWRIVAALAGECAFEHFAKEDVDRVERVMFLGSAGKGGPAFGKVPHAPVEDDGPDAQDDREHPMFAAARDVVWQLSNGRRRTVVFDDLATLHETFETIVDLGCDPTSGTPMHLDVEGEHRSVFLNMDAVDYVSIPTHLYEEGGIEARDRFLERGTGGRAFEFRLSPKTPPFVPKREADPRWGLEERAPLEVDEVFEMALVQWCFRAFLEDIHAGVSPHTETGDWSDVKVVHPGGEIAWKDLSRIDDDEMRGIMIQAVDHLHTALEKASENPKFAVGLAAFSASSVFRWDKPKRVPHFDHLDRFCGNDPAETR